jgi:hypothetical protein
MIRLMEKSTGLFIDLPALLGDVRSEYGWVECCCERKVKTSASKICHDWGWVMAWRRIRFSSTFGVVYRIL